MGLGALNGLDEDVARAELYGVCGSLRWARDVAKGRPYADGEALFAAADRFWNALDRRDHLEAFSHHPRLAADGAAEYEKKFGFVFFVFDPAMPDAQVQTRLQERLAHEPDEEYAIASGEQAKITRRRLESLLA